MATTRFALLLGLAALPGCTCDGAEHPCAGARPGDPSPYPDPLVQLSRLDGPTFVEILEVKAEGDTVYFCSAVQGLNVIDASDPRAMTTTMRLGASLGSSAYPRCQHLAVSSTAIFMSNRGDEIQPEPFVTAFDRDSGAELASYTEPDHAFEGLAATSRHVFAAAHDRGLVVLELRGDELVRVGSTPDLGNAWGVALHDDHLVVADADGTVAVVSVSDPTSPTVVGRVEVGGNPQAVAVDADTSTAWVAAGANGLVGVSLADPTAPAVVGQRDTPGSALAVALDAGHAFVADWNDVRAYDVRDPAAVALVASERIDVPEGFPRVLGVGASQGHVYMGEWTGLYAYGYEPHAVPDVWTADRTVDFGRVSAGETTVMALVLRNFGQAPLVISEVVTTGEAFDVSASALTIAPGAADAIEVAFAPDDDDPRSACLAIRSDDPDDRPLKLELRANQPSLGVGDPAPEVEVALLDGTTWRLADHAGEVVVLAYFATF